MFVDVLNINAIKTGFNVFRKIQKYVNEIANSTKLNIVDKAKTNWTYDTVENLFKELIKTNLRGTKFKIKINKISKIQNKIINLAVTTDNRTKTNSKIYSDVQKSTKHFEFSTNETDKITPEISTVKGNVNKANFKKITSETNWYLYVIAALSAIIVITVLVIILKRLVRKLLIKYILF